MSWAQRATQALTQAGYRRGGARRAVVELLDEQRCALSPAELGEELLARGREVSRASVYRVLEQLDRLGMLQRVEVGQGVVRYEPVRDGPEHHHHAVCEGCGRLDPFADEDLERAIRRASSRLNLHAWSHEIVIRGFCEACAGNYV